MQDYSNSSVLAIDIIVCRRQFGFKNVIFTITVNHSTVLWGHFE